MIKQCSTHKPGVLVPGMILRMIPGMYEIVSKAVRSTAQQGTAPHSTPSHGRARQGTAGHGTARRCATEMS